MPSLLIFNNFQDYKLNLINNITSSDNTTTTSTTLVQVDDIAMTIANDLVTQLSDAVKYFNTSTTSLQSVSIKLENVNMVLAVIATPALRTASNSSSTAQSYTYLPLPELDATNSTVSIGVLATGNPLIASVVVYDASLWKGNNVANNNDTASSSSSATMIYSDIVSLRVLTISRNSSTPQLILPTFIANLTSAFGTSSTTSMTKIDTFHHNCTLNQAETVLFLCKASGIIFNLTCSGLSSAKVRRSCPIPQQQCSVVNTKTQTITDSDYCRLTGVVGNVVSCKCGKEDNSGNSSSSTLDMIDATINLAISVQYKVNTIQGSIAVASDALSSNVLQTSSLILTTYSVLWGVMILLLIIRYLLRRKRMSIVQDAPTTLVVDFQEDQFFQVKKYLHKVLPKVYHKQRVIHRLWECLQEEHLLIRICKQFAITHRHNTEDRSTALHLLVVQLLTLISMSSFFFALLYDVQNPSDDGSCNVFVDEASCLDRKTFLDPWQTYCIWTTKDAVSAGTLLEMKESTILNTLTLVSSSKTMSCVYNENSGDSMIAAIALIAMNTLVAIPINMGLTFLIKCLHCSRTVGSHSYKEYTLLRYEYATSGELQELRQGLRMVEPSLNYPAYQPASALPPPLLSYLLSLTHEVSDATFGACVLHNLYIDLLGRTSAMGRLFWTYTKKDFIALRYVHKYVQYAAVALLIMMNGGSIYYIMLKGITKGDAWQVQFLRYYVFSFLSDVLFVQLLELVWIEVLLPSLIYKDVLHIHHQIVKELLSSSSGTVSTISPSYSSSISCLLASRKPTLWESRLAQACFRQQPDNSKHDAVKKHYVNWMLHLFALFPLQVHSIMAAIIASLLLTFIIILWYILPFLIVTLLIIIGIGGVALIIREYRIHERPKVTREHATSSALVEEDVFSDFSLSSEDEDDIEEATHEIVIDAFSDDTEEGDDSSLEMSLNGSSDDLNEDNNIQDDEGMYNQNQHQGYVYGKDADDHATGYYEYEYEYEDEDEGEDDIAYVDPAQDSLILPYGYYHHTVYEDGSLPAVWKEEEGNDYDYELRHPTEVEGEEEEDHQS